MPRTWRAGGIGPTTAKQNAGAGGVEVWSLERYELEKQKELLVILMKKLERYELEKQKELLIILLKIPGSSRLLMEVRAIRGCLLMEVRAIRNKAAGRVEDFPGPVVCNKSRRSSKN